MSGPLIVILILFILYILLSCLYFLIIYTVSSIKDESKGKIKKAYYITTVIFAFLILSKFSIDYTIKNLSFDSSFIMDNYITPLLKHETLTTEIILSIAIFFIFFVNVYVVPQIMIICCKPTKRKYLKMLKNHLLFDRLLPENKLRNCIYSKVKKKGDKFEDLITTFNYLYISKKVYLDSSRKNNLEISKRIMNFENEILGNKKNAILLGDAGCGKSTLLFKTFIEIVSKDCSKNKIIPFIVDLKNVDKDHLLIQEIIDQQVRVFKETRSYKNYLISCKNVDKEAIFIKIFEDLIKDGYQFLFMFDSLDECTLKEDISKEFSKLIEKLNYYESNYKFVIAARKFAFEEFEHILENNFSPYFVYNVRDYDRSEIKLYIEKLIDKQKIKKEDVDDIYRNIDMVTFNEKVNPFIVSMIINGFINKKEEKMKTKIVDILEDNIIRLILDVNENSRSGLKYNENTHRIIGVTTQFKNLGYSISKYLSFICSNTAEENIKKDIDELEHNTYLVDSNGFYYQKIFAEFYSASFIINTFKEKDNIHNQDYIKLIDQLFLKGQNNPLFEYLVLLTDKHDVDYDSSALNGILQYAISKYKQQPSLELYGIIFEKFEVMLTTLSKYNTKRVIKDRLPIDINATYDADKLTTWLYKKYFEFLIENDFEIDYGYFYHIISIVDKHHLTIKAIIRLNASTSIKKKMLSIIRDSYLNLNYNNSPILFFDLYYFNYDEKELIKNIITSNKNIKQLNLRELLDYSFYNDSLIEYGDLSIKLNKKYFPSIYNLELFINGYGDNKDNTSIRVSKKDNLIYDYKQEYMAVKMIDMDELKQKKINLEPSVLSLYIYSNNEKTLTNAIKNTQNLRSVEIDNGVQVLSENCFNKSISLKNIILPPSILQIQDFALYECHQLVNLTIPDSVTFLGESFIEDCFNLLSVKLPSNLKSLGQYAFEDDTSLIKIDFNQVNIELKEGLFKGCMSITNFEELNISKEIKLIPKQLFLECINLKEVDLSLYNKIEAIGNYCFARCEKLTKVVFPSSLKKVGMLVFYECSNLKEIIFNSLPSFSKQIFPSLDHNVKIIFNIEGKVIEKNINSNEKFNSLLNELKAKTNDDKFINGLVLEGHDDETYTLDYCFDDDIKEFKANDYAIINSCNIGALGNKELLNDVLFDENLLSLSEWLFEDCYSLYTVDLSKTKIKVLNKHIFENCYVLKEVLLPNTLKEIQEYAFENCYELSRVVLSNQVIDSNVLRIPSHIEYIGEFSFHNCQKIEKIEIESINTKIASFAFDGLKSLKQVHFPFNYDINNIGDGAFANCNESVDFGNIDSKQKERLLNK